MAKLGMPSVNIAFIEAGIEAIQRSQRGIVALLLEEDADTVTKLLTDHTGSDGKTTIKAIKNPFTVYTTDDIPDELSDDNKDYITKALIGYVKSPYRVKVYLMDKVTDETKNASADKFADALKTLATDRWDYLAIPTIVTAQCESVATWLKTNRENKGKRSKVVLPGYAADYEGVINFSNTKIVTASKTYTGAQYTPRIAGLIAGTPLTISATYAPLSEVIDCDRYTEDENDEKVNNGEFFIWYDGEKFKMSRAMNSLVTTTQGKLEAYQTIKSVDIMDAIYDDIKKTAQDSYIGKYTNDYDNKQLLISAIMGYFKELEDGRLLQKDYSEVDINVEKVKTYQLEHGLYTKEELADMDDLAIKKLDTKKQVLLTAKIKILDAMEDIDLPINI
ncbi:phage tail sheath subtilisin-like domain-containing protein [uncultured Megasphaera sp.]|uniref:phage tail sheath subtilisin-like domain-containing protein n=1 Tax=uncultured Megasphaera sp. TaxID=165188 RepID=UPI0025E2667C|nr:phage tail sheath subtilisin-like domain-containing protein [uncultured Megasphaera sp.]